MTTRLHAVRSLALLTLAAAVMAVAASPALAANPVIGTVTARLDNGFIMYTEDATSVRVTMTEATALKVDDGRGRWQASDLIPGLRVKVEGVYDQGTLIAREIKFSKEEKRIAEAIRAGLTKTEERVQRNADDIRQHAQTLGDQAQTLSAHGQTLNQYGDRIGAADRAILATNTRIERLDDYKVIESLTVLFPNAQAGVPQQYLRDLAALAQRAKGINGYMVQVDGYASAIGPRDYNTDLSHQRAEAVMALLQQEGGIPSANLFVPSAMGVSVQVGTDYKTRQGQAQNRRVVVTILQNTGIVAAER